MAADDVALRATNNVDEYAARVTPFLERSPVERNVLLTVIWQARRQWAAWTAAPNFWWITDGDDVVGAASWTPPFALLVSSMPEAGVAQLAAAALQRAAELGIGLRRVSGPASDRGRGYARRLVHDVSVAALRTPGVRTCTLHTDAANPVSNVIYRQIGYVPVAEHAQFALIG